MKSHENRSTILEYIFRNAPVARATIAEDTDITPATVTANVSTLISENLVTDLGEPEQGTESTPGRKRILIDLNPSHSYSMGIEFIDKYTVFCITNLRGAIIDKIVLLHKTPPTDPITDILIANIRILLSRNETILNRFIGIGIAVPGQMDSNQEHMFSNGHIRPDFDCVRIRKAFPYPIVCENNVRAMAYGEYLFHNKDCPHSFAFFHAGLGMFCAIIRNGEIFHGSNYFAGEIGHTTVNIEGRRCECGKYGCLQTYSGEKWLLKSAHLLYDSNTKTILKSLVNNKEDITIHDLTNAYSLGDPLVGSYISEALKYLGITISNIAIILNPGKIYLHGEMFCNQDIRNELMDFIERQLLFVDTSPGNNIEILPYSVTDGAIGASAYAIKQLFINKEASDY